MNSMIWLVLVVVFINLTISKFVDVTLDPENNINLENNVAVSDLFETAGLSSRCKTMQKWHDIPIFGATLVVELDLDDSSNKIPVYGHWYDETDIDKLVPSKIPEITEDRAFEIALTELNLVQTDIHPPTECNLNIYFHDSFPYLSYIVKFSYFKQEESIEIHQPMIIINALNGDILQIDDESYNLIEACGDGGNGLVGRDSYCVDLPALLINDNINPVLENDVIQIYDLHNIENWWDPLSIATKVTCSYIANTDDPRCYIDDEETNGAYCPACDLYKFANVTFELFGEWTLATYPIPQQYIPMKLFVHLGTNVGNAFYNGYIFFGDGHSTWYPLTVLDVTAHEIAHGFTHQGSNLDYSGESGGMNEAFSDIAGEAAKYWHRGTNDWKTGADMVKNGIGALRYMYDPPLDGVSIDHYSNYFDGLNVHYSSGLYNKAAYNLNETGNWNMEQIFRVFAWANLFYWTRDSTFNEGINGLHHALYDIYDDGITNVDVMADSLDLAFLDVGLAKIVPVGLCNAGNSLHRFCYYKNISASLDSITYHTINIQSDVNGNTSFDIYFTVNNNDCMRPTLSFSYQLIDYDQDLEYIDVFDDNDVLINRCQGGQSCDTFDSSCIDDYDLGITAVQFGETYKVSLVQSDWVNSLCGLTLNASVTLRCEYGISIAPTPQTVNPTTVPTAIPTQQTTEPTTVPTAAPTIPLPISCGDITTGSIVQYESVIYEFAICASSTVTFSNCDSEFDTQMRLYRNGVDITSTSDNNCNGDDCYISCPTSLREEMTFTDLAAGTYWLIIKGWTNSAGNYVIETTCNRPSFDWEGLIHDGLDIPNMELIEFNVNPDDLSLNIIVELDYIGKAFADFESRANFGVTYVLDFEDFDAHNDRINEPGTCENRMSESFINKSFDEYWTYSLEPQNNGNIGQIDKYLSYPLPPQPMWDISMKDNECSTVIYSGHFTWDQLRNCKSFNNGNSYTMVESDYNWLNLTGTFYINIVSPFWYTTYDTGFYRVYQLLSKPFVIAVSSTIYVLGSSGINLMTVCIIAVYKEDLDTDFKLIFVTETAEYLKLTRNSNSKFEFTKDESNNNILISDDFDASIIAENINCIENKEYICTQFWEVNAIDITCEEGGIFGIDFSGQYALTFNTECKDFTDNYCNEWLNNHPDIRDNEISLTAKLVWRDNICKPQIFKVSLSSEMLFYTDDGYTNNIDTESYLYQVGEDRVYVEIETTFPDNTYDIFNTELMNVWICTFENDYNVPSDQSDLTNMGCLGSTSRDIEKDEFFYHIFEDGIQIELNHGFNEESEGISSIERFSFIVPNEVERDTLYIHAQIEVELQELTNNQLPRRRRVLLDTKIANKIEHFGEQIGINNNNNQEKPNRIVPNPVIPNPIQQEPSTFVLPSLLSPWIIIITILFGLLLIFSIAILMCYYNKSERGRRRMSGYASVKNTDHDDSEDFNESEANAINL